MDVLQRINKIKSEIGRTIPDETTKYNIAIKIVELEIANIRLEQNLPKEISNLANVIAEKF